MKYELEIKSDSRFGIRKVMDVPLWNSNQIFDDVESLSRYIEDFLELSCPINIAIDRINASVMNSWALFE